MSRAATNTGCVPAHRVTPVNRSVMTSTKSRGKTAFVLPSDKRLPESRSDSSASSTKSMAVMQSSLSSPLYNVYVKPGHSSSSKQNSSHNIKPQGSMVSMSSGSAKEQHVEYEYGYSDNKKVRPYYVSFFQPVLAVYSFVMLLYCV